MWSVTTLLVAMWRMQARGVTWSDLGLRKPDHVGRMVLTSVLILAGAITSIILFELVKEQLPTALPPDTSSDNATSKFGEMQGNWGHLLLILPLIWLESMLEELLDRGFLMNWIEKLFSFTSASTVIAVVTQAALFGFRHSNDLSERSITVGLIGLVMGIAYVKCGRNLWPLIIAHCILNSISMIERVLS